MDELAQLLDAMELPTVAGTTPLNVLLADLLGSSAAGAVRLPPPREAVTATTKALTAAALTAAITRDRDEAAVQRAATLAADDSSPLSLLSPTQWVQYALFLERRCADHFASTNHVTIFS